MLNRAQTRSGILSLSCTEAKEFFLTHESYCNIDLPRYFDFSPLLKKLDEKIRGKNISNFYSSKVGKEPEKMSSLKPGECENVNYTIFANKDGRYSWRPLQLINPAIYVAIVNAITEEKNWEEIKERFQKFSENPNIECSSIPVMSLRKKKNKAEQIGQWIEFVEHRSLELALDFSTLVHIDIANCYDSIYTHSIAWALHGKTEAKSNRKPNNLIGNKIDCFIQSCSYGQTNGIPQGSVLMDFIAEMVLGYADMELTKKMQNTAIKEYCILRYRDDYRIFTNGSQEAETIIKLLSEVLLELGLKINTSKTIISKSLIQDSLKPGKIYWVMQKRYDSKLYHHLLRINELAINYPNSGALIKALSEFNLRLKKTKKINENLQSLIAIVTLITHSNPRIYPMFATIVSRLIDFMDKDEVKKSTIEKVIRKFSDIPNTALVSLWLQRIMINYDRDYNFEESLCKVVKGEKVEIWNTDWLATKSLKKIFDNTSIINTKTLESSPRVIQQEEVSVFNY